MANKKKKVDEDKQAKAVEKKIKKQMKKGVKKAMKNKTFVTIVAILLVIAVIAVATIYFVKPELLDDLFGTNLSQTKKRPATIHDGDLAVYFLDIGQGDFIYISFPDGKDMVIDAGKDLTKNITDEQAAAAFNELEEYNKDDVIDYVMLTHGDMDHVSFMDELFDLYQVNKLFMPNIKPEESRIADANLDAAKLAMFTDPDVLTTAVYAEFFIAALNEPNCEIVLNIGNYSIVGETYTFDFYCLNKEQWQENKLKDDEKNAVSPIGILEYNGKRIVFTGDSNLENEPIFVEQIKSLDCDVLKAGHHGSHTSSMPDFLDAITCEHVIFSCGYDNRHEHPRQDTLDRFVERNYEGIYRTDLQGTITLVISGETLTITTQKQATKEELLVGWDTIKAEQEAA